MRSKGLEVAAWLALLGAFWALATMLSRPPEGSASVAEAPGIAARSPASPLVAAAREVRDALVAQPDVATAEVTFFTPEARPLLVLVQVSWSTPTPPPHRRLDTIARWTRDRFGGACDVHVVTPEHRTELVQR